MSKALPLEERLRENAAGFDYPPTPSISAAVRRRVGAARAERRKLVLRGALLALVILLAAALAVPGVRAQVVEFLRIGAVRIFPAPPTPTVNPAPTSPASIGEIPRTATPAPGVTRPIWPEHIVSMQGLAGETTLEAARKKLSFAIRLPAIPVDLRAPDRVFVQEDGQILILVWLDSREPDKVRLSLHEIGSGALTITKYEPPILEKTHVGGHEAAWVEGPYLVELTNGNMTWRRLVDGKTLIWEDGGITYRLESTLPLDEALRIAESLK